MAMSDYSGSHVFLITVEELSASQATDEMFQEIRHRINSGNRDPYVEYQRGLFCCIAPLEGVFQILVPKDLRQKVLFLAHYTPVAGHPGVTRQYYTMRRTFYWPAMMRDIQSASSNCHECSIERVKLRSHQSKLKIFPAKQPLESVANDILGPLHRTKQEHRFVLVMTDRFSKLVKVTALRNITVLTVAKGFLEHWIFCYGVSSRLLSENETQFTAKLFQYMYSNLGVSNLFTATYHPQANGQTERFNLTLIAGIRAFVAENPQTWHEYVGTLTYAYNTQVHITTGNPLFDLVLSQPPAAMIFKRLEELIDQTNPREAKIRFKSQINRLVRDS